MTALGLELDADSASSRRKLHRVVQQVPDYLFQPDWIGIDKDRFIRGLNFDHDLLALRLAADGFNCVVDRNDRRYSLAVQFELTAAQAREIEQIANEFGLGHSVSFDGVGHSRQVRRPSDFIASQEQFSIAKNDIQRIAELVRHDREKL